MNGATVVSVDGLGGAGMGSIFLTVGLHALECQLFVAEPSPAALTLKVDYRLLGR